MGRDAILLLLQARIVDDHGNTERHHEQHRQRQQAGDQRAHQAEGQGAVEPDQFRTAGIRELRNGDLAVVDLIAHQVQFTQARTFTFAVEVGNGEDGQHTGRHRWHHRHEDGRRVHVQRTGGTGGRATPGGHVHHATGEDDQAGHDPRAHADAAVERQHGGHADHVGGRAVTIQGHDERQYRSTDRHFQRVALDHLEDLAHGRVEQAGVDHQGEIENGEHQHHAGRRELGDAFEHHRADFGTEAAEQGEDDWNEDQGDQRGQALGHDQEHERDDHGEAKESQHGNTPGVARLGNGRIGRDQRRTGSTRRTGGVAAKRRIEEDIRVTIVVVKWAGRTIEHSL
ncbi:hypothetical protein D3C76_639140 [compost metagenome]